MFPSSKKAQHASCAHPLLTGIPTLASGVAGSQDSRLQEVKEASCNLAPPAADAAPLRCLRANYVYVQITEHVWLEGAEVSDYSLMGMGQEHFFIFKDFIG